MTIRRIPSLNWLRVFETAARTESFAHAAKLLNMSPPAVSQQIKSLEGYLGKALFKRGAHNVSLTDEGRAFLPIVQQSLSSMETTAVALFGPKESETLVIQVLYLFACGWLPERLKEFEKLYPGIHLQITCGNTPDDFHRSRPDLQLAFGSATDFPENAERLIGETIIPVATPEIAEQINQPTDFLKHRLIEVSTHQSGWMQVLGSRVDGDLSADYRFTDNTVTALAMAGAGYGIALARSPVSDALVESNRLVPCLDSFQVAGVQHYYLFNPLAQSIKSSALTFQKWLKSELQKSADN
ncbi:LysR family transcriptional regulator [Kiloniella majae]|uniref:LysR family transcriptional regulator n=1 Tax=Kiloniella majae TaxID=1938558 RepID=UPI000A278CD5|nr:LysR family transcriptional regulator [Kiloniella majae]